MNDEPQPDAAGTHRLGHGEGMTRPQKRASLVAGLLLLAVALATLHSFLPGLIWAAIFAIAVWPSFNRLSRRWPQHRRTLLPALFVLAVLLAFVVPLAMVAVPLITDAHAAADWVAQVQQSGMPAPAFLTDLPYGDKLTLLWQQEVGRPGQVPVLAGHVMQGGLVGLGRAVGAQAIHRLILLLVMLVALFFLLRDAEDVAAQVRIGARRAFGPAGEDVGRQIIRSIHGTVDGMVIVGLAEGVVIGIAYWATGVPHPTLFGLLTAVLAMIPFGAPVAFCVAALILLAQGAMAKAIVIVVTGTVVTFVADHFFRPVLIGGATKLPFVWVLLGILGGVETWGLFGLFVGPAVMAALILLWRQWVGSERGPINPATNDLGGRPLPAAAAAEIEG